MEMYWKTYEPVSDRAIEQIHLIPEDYMNIEKYNKYYKDNKKSIRRYMTLLQLYEYLAFTYSLKILRLPDPLTYTWTELWTESLLKYQEFLDIHEYHRPYYERYAEFVDSIILKQKIK
ncbi:MAG: hypothetical protein FJ121_10200 [Deltaproteobacteria bacterium]|nr:hypothetical protein [Deltaproteobacteria bacterium]